MSSYLFQYQGLAQPVLVDAPVGAVGLEWYSQHPDRLKQPFRQHAGWFGQSLEPTLFTLPPALSWEPHVSQPSPKAFRDARARLVISATGYSVNQVPVVVVPFDPATMNPVLWIPTPKSRFYLGVDQITAAPPIAAITDPPALVPPFRIDHEESLSHPVRSRRHEQQVAQIINWFTQTGQIRGTINQPYLSFVVENIQDWDGMVPPASIEEALNQLAARSDTTPSGPAGGVLSGSYPNPSFAADMATQAELDVVSGGLAAHLADTSDAHDASAISVLNVGGFFTATDVEAALAELYGVASTVGAGIIIERTVATPISATPAGQLQATPDSPYQLIADGSAVNYHGPIWKLTKPVSGDFAWINQGGASVATTNGGIYITAPAGAGTNIRIRKKAAPATPYVIEAIMMTDNYPINTLSCGIGFRESATGKLELLEIASQTTSDALLAAENFNSATSFNATRGTLALSSLGTGMLWLRMRDDGSNIYFDYSFTGYGWVNFVNVVHASFFTVGPDEVLFYAYASNASSKDAHGHLIHWKES